MGNCKIWPSADAKPLNRSSPNLKHVLRQGYLLPKNLGSIRPGDFAPIFRPTRNIHPKLSNVYFTFFSSSEPLQTRPLGRFSRLIRHTTWFCARKCLLGWEKLISKNRFIRKIYNGALAPMGNFENSGCMQDRVVIFDFRVGFSETASLMALFKFTCRLPLLPWQRNKGQNRL